MYSTFRVSLYKFPDYFSLSNKSSNFSYRLNNFLKHSVLNLRMRSKSLKLLEPCQDLYKKQFKKKNKIIPRINFDLWSLFSENKVAFFRIEEAGAPPVAAVSANPSTWRDVGAPELSCHPLAAVHARVALVSRVTKLEASPCLKQYWRGGPTGGLGPGCAH